MRIRYAFYCFMEEIKKSYSLLQNSLPYKSARSPQLVFFLKQHCYSIAYIISAINHIYIASHFVHTKLSIYGHTKYKNHTISLTLQITTHVIIHIDKHLTNTFNIHIRNQMLHLVAHQVKLIPSLISSKWATFMQYNC